MTLEDPGESQGSHWPPNVVLPAGIPARDPFPILNLILFLATVVTTLAAGATVSWNGNPLAGIERLYREPGAAIEGVPYAAALLAILGAHEMGHYLASRWHGVRVTLPYFLPAPHYFGTFGAFIRMKSPLPDRKTLFDIAVAGPLAGFAVAVPVTLWGLSLSKFLSSSTEAELGLGPSLLFIGLAKLTLGFFPSNAGIELHPLATAGWLGFFVTALNLLPIGQLDGGHLVYSFFQRRYRVVSWLTLCALIPMGFFFWPGWFFWVILVALVGLRHPTPLDSWTPLGNGRKLLGGFTFLILILTFTPVPFLF